jgi:hypothetical protein
VTHELVAIAQTADIQHMIATDHNGVVEGASASETRSLQPFDVVEGQLRAPAQLPVLNVSASKTRPEPWRQIQRVFEIYLKLMS